jgi:propionate catabolism operon transcriptional regulator
MKQLLGKAKKYAMTDAAILIQGETGTGKGLLSESIHNLSSRKHEPFVAVNCAALPDSLLESELFGYEEGAFTGAKKGGKIGLFELANKGTLFLDEMAAISNSIQSRLVKVIEEKEIMRVGGDRYVPVDIRIISACNKDLRREAISGKFRADLYFRIAVLNLNTQPLRDRFEDVFYIMEDLLTKYGKKPKALSAKMIKTMESYSWPGNIRELRSFIESYLILLGESTCNSHLFLSLFDEKLGCGEDQTTALSGVVENACELENNLFTSIGEAIKDGSLKEVLGKYEIFVINETLRGCRFNKKETAKRLGISVNTLWRKLNKSEESAGF